MRTLVLDTNIVLDVFVFDDAAAKPLAAALEQGEIEWIATQPMRDELERVLAYPHLVSRLEYYGLDAQGVLARFDRHARIVEVAAKACVTCSDADDQKFIDLAVSHRCAILSKDNAVLTMTKRLAALEVSASRSLAG
ncbi:MAG: putative toxin-antitoxin system toxin component, PIN family [Pseudomonadota bacterium]